MFQIATTYPIALIRLLLLVCTVLLGNMQIDYIGTHLASRAAKQAQGKPFDVRYIGPSKMRTLNIGELEHQFFALVSGSAFFIAAQPIESALLHLALNFALPC